MVAIPARVDVCAICSHPRCMSLRELAVQRCSAWVLKSSGERSSTRIQKRNGNGVTCMRTPRLRCFVMEGLRLPCSVRAMRLSLL